MPFNEQTLLSGLRVLGPPFTRITSLAELQKALRFELPRYASNERVSEREALTVLTNLNNAIPGQVTRIVDALEHSEIGDPTLYWSDLWLLLFASAQQLAELATDPNASVREVNRFFTLLRKGTDTLPGYTLKFSDQRGKKRTIQVSHLTGWHEQKPGRSITVADAIQAGTPQRDFQQFDDYFAAIAVGTDKAAAINYKQSLLATCIDLEQKYWDAIK